MPERAPRVLGVDEFAFRKGWRYGTVLVDVEAARVVDVLPDRDAATFAGWLREHPGAEIICRDRASAYSSAVREAAPGAQEVADRWHLLHNLSSAVEKTCHQHRSCLRKQAEADRDAEPRRIIDPLPPPTLPPTKIAVRTVDRYSDIHSLVSHVSDGHKERPVSRSSPPVDTDDGIEDDRRNGTAPNETITEHTRGKRTGCRGPRPPTTRRWARSRTRRLTVGDHAPPGYRFVGWVVRYVPRPPAPPWCRVPGATWSVTDSETIPERRGTPRGRNPETSLLASRGPSPDPMALYTSGLRACYGI
ncbi:transposase [Streptomyces sp. MNU76]|uniref:transposase n=1 Tax=Streptomyces sp. MNU76 TaxID=2560026 RepID=UPI001E3B4A4A|nr:transposase [Streptomyces sp. MNU76]MCC9705042.1 transposase [Streptomyces sp. MNU76]